jgi:hypothetical protein
MESKLIELLGIGGEPDYYGKVLVTGTFYEGEEIRYMGEYDYGFIIYGIKFFNESSDSFNSY